ncbi:MAG: phosphoenolpyruvate--protein phosphotransferase [Spirochaetia bacterium]|jgi:phosphotransferase system enzyme I (PtsI)|nr:phosphoenolpyruvate--protein phosphotransferase [Spirochaetia bacterium]
MKKFKGVSASAGIVIGKVFLYLDDNLKVPKYRINPEDIDSEMERFHLATKKVENDLKQIQTHANSQMVEEESRFLDSHMLMLSDPEFINQIESNLKGFLRNIEWILLMTVKQFIGTLKKAESPYLVERTVDLYDVTQRIHRHLMFREKISLADIDKEVIVVTHNLMPSDTATMNRQMVKGLVLNAGGKTSHTAILARAFGIASVLGLTNITDEARSGDTIIVDGNLGTVILNPDNETLIEYEERARKWLLHEKQLSKLDKLSSVTLDGRRILLRANIEMPEEADQVLVHGADGIGLFRSEFLFLKPSGFSSEDDQYVAYSDVVRKMKDKGGVTIRTLDVGGDKIIPDFETSDDKNPLLGWRAIRFCLARKDIFKVQMRAILRASVHGDLRIMFPMISGVEELEDALEFLDETRKELKNEGILFDENIRVGIMIEVPSAAIISDILAKKVDFFSIGTNDLIQYTVAVDRGNENIAYLYKYFHPGVLRLIKMVIDNAHDAGIPVAMCGEMAGDPLASVVLLGMGLDAFSMSSSVLPSVKEIIRSVRVDEAEELVAEVMKMSSFQKIEDYVSGWINERFDNISI